MENCENCAWIKECVTPDVIAQRKRAWSGDPLHWSCGNYKEKQDRQFTISDYEVEDG